MSQPSGGKISALNGAGLLLVACFTGAGSQLMAAAPEVASNQEARVSREAASAQSDLVFRADVELVLHHVAVLDDEGGPVTGLKVSDFRVYEDGVRQEIALFLSPQNSPLDVALLLDSSTSLLPFGVTVRRAAKTFLSSLEIEDCVFLLPFNEDVAGGTWGRALDPRLQGVVDRIVMHGGTALYDALLAGLQGLDAGRAVAASGPLEPRGCGSATAAVDSDQTAIPALLTRRRAVVLLTDGADEGSLQRFPAVLARARRDSVPVFPVALGQARQDNNLIALLRELSRATGGRLMESSGPAALRQAYSEVLALLRASYVVGYRPQPAAGLDSANGSTDPPVGALLPQPNGRVPPQGEGSRAWHPISMRVVQPTYRLLFRAGYYR